MVIIYLYYNILNKEYSIKIFESLNNYIILNTNKKIVDISTIFYNGYLTLIVLPGLNH